MRRPTKNFCRRVLGAVTRSRRRPPKGAVASQNDAGAASHDAVTMISPDSDGAMRIAERVVREIMLTIGARPPETGGILLGPLGTEIITHYHFDDAAACSAVTYTPDHVGLGRRMREEWIPAGLDMKGFVHAHPAGVEGLSGGDLEYIGRLLARNTDMAVFAAPIILPHAFRICPWLVLRGNPPAVRRSRLILF